MSTLKFNRWQSIDGITRNAVLQVVSKEVTTTTTTTSESFVDATDMFLAITPTSATSKILVNFSTAIFFARNAANVYGTLRLLRNGVEIYAPYTTSDANYLLGFNAAGASAVNIYHQYPLLFEDSPSSTSEVTYKVQFGMYDNALSGQAIVNSGGLSSYLTLMEIAQ